MASRASICRSTWLHGGVENVEQQRDFRCYPEVFRPVVSSFLASLRRRPDAVLFPLLGLCVYSSTAGSLLGHRESQRFMRETGGWCDP